MVRHYVKGSININEGQHPTPKENIKLISKTCPVHIKISKILFYMSICKVTKEGFILS